MALNTFCSNIDVVIHLYYYVLRYSLGTHIAIVSCASIGEKFLHPFQVIDF